MLMKMVVRSVGPAIAIAVFVAEPNGLLDTFLILLSILIY